MENNEKLVITIKNTNFIELSVLARGLSSFEKLYKSFTKDEKDEKTKLLVKEVRKSSIEIHLIESVVNIANIAYPVVIEKFTTLCGFVCFIELIVKKLKKEPEDKIEQYKKENNLPEPEKEDYKNIEETLNISARDNKDSTINISYAQGDNIIINIHINGREARQMKDEIPHITSRKNTDGKIFSKQLFRWVKADFKTPEGSNNGKISNIAKKDLHVTFNNDETKQQMTTSNARAQWQDTYYIVDVEVLYDDNDPKVYKILKNYPDESFPTDPQTELPF